MNSLPRTISEIARWIITAIGVAALAVFLVWAFLGSTEIDGHSMNPLLYSEDTVLVDKLAYSFTDIDRFDVVYFKYGAEGLEKTSVKRVVGLPGETIKIKDGKVYINGKVISLPDGVSSITSPGIADSGITLDYDEYFLLGDNSDSSEDSRFIAVGSISRSNIIGKVWLRLFPFDHFGFVK